MSLQDVSSSAGLTDLVEANSEVAIHFWASWCDACSHMDTVVSELAQQYTSSTFARVEAEEHEELSLKHGVTAVPYFVVFKQGEVVSKVEGAQPADLTAAVRAAFTLPAAAPAQAPAATDLDTRLKQLLTRDPVMLFMKGDTETPRCGFSRKVVEALVESGIDFSTFDILKDQEVRQGLKELSNWPTYPQLYVKGELMGGCDIILEMHENKELKGAVEEQLGAGGPDLEALVRRSDVMLFMKGDRQQPRCGFSGKVVEALDATDLTYETFDILKDQEVRQGLKKLSNWPTYPQLYVKGELMGGCDIILEMHENKELKGAIEEQLA